MLLFCLSVCILIVGWAFTCVREETEDLITPLCPRLIVRDSELSFKLPLLSWSDRPVSSFFTNEITDDKDRLICKVALDWPRQKTDPFLPGTNIPAVTARLLNASEVTLATVVARPISVIGQGMIGQGLALCRAGTCEVFGYVVPDGEHKYHVRHRTNTVHLLTLLGDFQTWDVEGYNPFGSKVFSVEQHEGECSVRVLRDVDAGLVISCLLAVYLHRRFVNAPEDPYTGVQLTPREEDISEGDSQDAAALTLDVGAEDASQPHFTGPFRPFVHDPASSAQEQTLSAEARAEAERAAVSPRRSMTQ